MSSVGISVRREAIVFRLAVPLDVVRLTHADHRQEITDRAVAYLADVPRVKRTADIAREIAPADSEAYVARLLGYAFQGNRHPDVVQWSGRETGHASLWAHRDWIPTLEATRPRRVAA